MGAGETEFDGSSRLVGRGGSAVESRSGEVVEDVGSWREEEVQEDEGLASGWVVRRSRRVAAQRDFNSSTRRSSWRTPRKTPSSLPRSTFIFLLLLLLDQRLSTLLSTTIPPSTQHLRFPHLHPPSFDHPSSLGSRSSSSRPFPPTSLNPSSTSLCTQGRCLRPISSNPISSHVRSPSSS